MAILPRCELSGTSATTAVSPALTGWTNAGAGVSGTAPAAGDFVVIILVNNTASTTVTQTSGSPWAPFDGNGTNLGAAVGLSSSVWYKIWEGNETAPTWTWSAGTRNTYTVQAITPDSGYMIFPDVWGTTKKDTAAATTHTPNTAAVTSPYTDATLILTGAVVSVTGSTTAITWTASTNYTIPSGASTSNTGTTGQFVYGTAIEWFNGRTGTVTPGAEGIKQGTSTTTYAVMYHLLLRELQISTTMLDIVQTVVATGGTSATLPAATTQGNGLVVIASLQNASNIVAPAVTGVTLGGAPDNFAVADDVGVVGSSNSYYAGIWVDADCAGGQTAVAVTATDNVNTTNTGIIVLEVAGLGQLNEVDQFASGTGTSTAPSSGATSTTTQASELWVGAYGGGFGLSAIAGPSGTGGNVGLFLSSNMEGGAYAIATGTGAATFSGTQKSSFAWCAVVVTLIPGDYTTTTVLSGTVSFPAATVNAGSGLTTTLLSGTVSFPARTVNAGSTKTTTVLSGTVSFPAPTITAQSNVSLTTTVLSGTVSFPAPTITAQSNASVTTTVLGPAATFPARTVNAGEALTTTALAGTVSFPAVTIRADQALTTTVLSGSVSFPAAALRADQGLTAAALAGTVSFPAPAITAQSNASVTPSALAVSVSFPAPAVSSSESLTTALLAGSVSFPARTVNAGSGLTTTVLAGTVSFPAPAITAQTNATAAPGVLAASASFPAPVVNAGSVVTTSVLAAAASFPAATLRADQALTTAVLPGSVSFPAPAVSAGSVITTSALVTSVSFPAPSVSAGAAAVGDPVLLGAPMIDTSVSSLTSASLSPTAGRVLGVVIAAGHSSAIGTITVTDTFTGTGTWRYKQIEGGTTETSRACIAWARLGATPGTGTVTVHFGTTVQYAKAQVTELPDASDMIGASGANVSISPAPTLALSATSHPTGVVLAVAASRDAPGDITPGTDYAELYDSGV